MASTAPVSREGIGWAGFGLRFVVALALVYATYNPWDVSYVHWIIGAGKPAGASSWFDSPALKFVVGIALAIGWIVYTNSARRSLGAVGILLIVALCAGVIWLLVEQGLANTSIPSLTHIALIVVALVLAVGMSWSHVRRQLTGQVDTDEVDSR
jgi:FtsH-binding integral membrane protein